MAISQVIKFLTELESENDSVCSGEKNVITQRKLPKVAPRTMSIGTRIKPSLLVDAL